MFLSRLVLNARSRQVRREVAEPYQLHRTLMRAFGPKTASERVLFRLECARDGEPLVVLVQSIGRPDWVCVQATPGYLIQPPESKEFEPCFQEGQRLSFRLRANPTVKRAGRRIGLITEEGQLDWLGRKGAAGGFRVVSVLAIDEGMVRGRKADDGRRQELTHLSVRFDGLLQVTDPERLAQAIRAGVGPGKGLGFGLLSLARAE